jgi:hypothetical protein
VAALALLVAVDMARVWRATNHHDLDVFVLAARRLAAGEDIYADTARFQAALEGGTFSMKDTTVVWPYAYGPLIAMLFVPALGVPYGLVQASWWGSNVVALLLGSWLTLRAMGRVTPGRVALVLLMLYRFEPAVVALRLGQIELVQYLLLAFSLYALSRSWEGRAGVALGLAAGLKFVPAGLIALLIWRRRWRAAGWATATALVVTVGSFALVGADALRRYLSFTAIYGIGGAFAAFPLNQSLNGFFSRNLVRNVFSATLKGWDLPWLARGLIVAGDALFILTSACLTWRHEGWAEAAEAGGAKRFNLEFALSVVALLLVSPHAQVYTFVWALVAFIALASWLLDREGARWWMWGALLVAYLLVGRNVVFFHPGVTRFVQSHYLFGALLAWGLLAWTLHQGRASGKRDLAP